MSTTPALHPQSLEYTPDLAPDSPRGEAVPSRGVESEVVPNVVPCTSAFDPNERRAYGGVFAWKLAGIAERLTKLRFIDGWGFSECLYGFFELGQKMRHAMYIYTRVKDAMAVLYDPEEIELPINRHGEYLVSEPRPVHPKFTWDVSPQEGYKAEPVCYENGQDIRGSSHHWVERRARQVKSRARQEARDAYIAAHGLVAAKPRPPVTPHRATNTAPIKRVFTPRPMTTGEIWPPVPIPSKIDTHQITVTPVIYPLIDKGIAALGRKLGVEFYYYDYYEDEENIANMWTGEEGELRRERGPP